MADSFSLDPQHTALLIMDYQNGIVARSAGQTQAGPLERTASVLAAARAARAAVIYIVVQFREDYPEVSPRNLSFSRIRSSGQLVMGSPDAAIHEQVAPLPSEIVLTKHRVGAFSTTPLETMLRARDIHTLVLCGIATSGVVLSTVRWAADIDYRLVVVEDCCADNDEEVHRVLTQKIFPRQAAVVSAQQVIEALGK